MFASAVVLFATPHSESEPKTILATSKSVLKTAYALAHDGAALTKFDIDDNNDVEIDWYGIVQKPKGGIPAKIYVRTTST